MVEISRLQEIFTEKVLQQVRTVPLREPRLPVPWPWAGEEAGEVGQGASPGALLSCSGGCVALGSLLKLSEPYAPCLFRGGAVRRTGPS